LSEDFIEKSHQDGIVDHSGTKNSLTHEDKSKQHSRREHKWLLPSVKGHAEYVTETSKRYKVATHENGTSSNVLVSKKEQRESKLREDKKKVREDALLIASEYQGTYLKSGKKISLQEVERKINSAVIIQQRIRIFFGSIIASINSSSRNNDKITKGFIRYLLLKWRCSMLIFM
jgi:hypothetical protein